MWAVSVCVSGTWFFLVRKPLVLCTGRRCSGCYMALHISSLWHLTTMCCLWSISLGPGVRGLALRCMLWQGTKLETWANAKDVWHFRTSWRFLWLLHLSKRVKKGKEKSSWASGKGPCNSHKVSMLFCEVFAHLKNIIFKFTISLFCVGMWVSLLFKYSGENECGICVICDILKYDLEI